jgi:MSHA biogenesis protein MshO
VVDTPVTYRCDRGNLTRHWGYAITKNQDNPPVGGQSALIAQNVTACIFAYDPLVISERSGLVSMQIALTKNNETVTLYHEVHVSNVP